jgi:hypothetical protein
MERSRLTGRVSASASCQLDSVSLLTSPHHLDGELGAFPALEALRSPGTRAGDLVDQTLLYVILLDGRPPLIRVQSSELTMGWSR